MESFNITLNFLWIFNFVTFLILFAVFFILIHAFIKKFHTIANISLSFAMSFFGVTLFNQNDIKSAALLVCPLFFALALVSLQEHFSEKNTSKLEQIHKALYSEDFPASKKFFEQNKELLREIKSLKHDIEKLNSKIESKNKSTVIKENQSSLINFSPKFIKEK